ncbi:hypothetical protein [Paracoccus aminophilus]|uniref:hypothetical protein n=1 Tax=Paracoccus aminophilus TaxID=34003 RepID=UPI0005A09FF9|nr:hypothetical protein [Paracoccus aminophilus]
MQKTDLPLRLQDRGHAFGMRISWIAADPLSLGKKSLCFDRGNAVFTKSSLKGELCCSKLIGAYPADNPTG